MKVWVVTDETPHRDSERDEEFGVGLAVYAVFSSRDLAIEYARLQADADLRWEDDQEVILLGPGEEAYSVVGFDVDAELGWIEAARLRRRTVN